MTVRKHLSTKKIILGSCAFRQPFAESHCKYIHGYLLIAKLWFECAELDKNNWVVDFGSLSQLKHTLENKFDHTTCISATDPEIATFKKSNNFIREQTEERCWVKKCEIWEHSANSGVYTR